MIWCFKNLKWRFTSDIWKKRDLFISEARKDYFGGYYISSGEIFSGFNMFFKSFFEYDLVRDDDYVFVSKKIPQKGAIVHFTPNPTITCSLAIIKRIKEFKNIEKISYALITDKYIFSIHDIITEAGGLFFAFEEYDNPGEALNGFNRKLRKGQ